MEVEDLEINISWPAVLLRKSPHTFEGFCNLSRNVSREEGDTAEAVLYWAPDLRLRVNAHIYHMPESSMALE